MLSFILWEITSETPEGREPGKQKPGWQYSYFEVMQTDKAKVSKKQLPEVLENWKQFVRQEVKDILPLDKNIPETLSDNSWEEICRQWISYRKNNEEEADLMPALIDHLETLLSASLPELMYRTPRVIMDVMVQYLKQNGTSLHDPYPRSGELLEAAARYMPGLKYIESAAPPGKAARKIAALRLLLVNRRGLSFHIANTPDTTQHPRSEFDLILSNPPFGTGDISKVLAR